jgi:hypothetical protein
MKLCIYTRFYNEDQCIIFFIEHYINLGFDKIFILKSDKKNYNLPDKYLNYVNIILVDNLGDQLLPKYDFIVKNTNFDWILTIDSDEILILNNKYKNIKQFINSKLSINKNINTFFFRWGMLNKYDIEQNNNFKYIINNYKIHENEHIKTMVKRSELNSIKGSHICSTKNKNIIYFDNNIIYDNNPKQPINNNSYQDCILVHILTRSINDIVIKALNTIFNGKIINNINDFINLINNVDFNTDNILHKFKEVIGRKATDPFAVAKVPLCNINIINYTIYNYNFQVFNKKLENISVINSLNKIGVNEIKYLTFIEKLNEYIINEKYDLFHKLLKNNKIIKK